MSIPSTIQEPGLPPVLAGSALLGSALDLRRDMLGECERAFRELGDGLLTSQDAQWQRQKRFLQPLFTSRRVASYVPAGPTSPSSPG